MAVKFVAKIESEKKKEKWNFMSLINVIRDCSARISLTWTIDDAVYFI